MKQQQLNRRQANGSLSSLVSAHGSFIVFNIVVMRIEIDLLTTLSRSFITEVMMNELRCHQVLDFRVFRGLGKPELTNRQPAALYFGALSMPVNPRPLGCSSNPNPEVGTLHILAFT